MLGLMQFMLLTNLKRLEFCDVSVKMHIVDEFFSFSWWRVHCYFRDLILVVDLITADHCNMWRLGIHQNIIGVLLFSAERDACHVLFIQSERFNCLNQSIKFGNFLRFEFILCPEILIDEGFVVRLLFFGRQFWYCGHLLSNLGLISGW